MQEKRIAKNLKIRKVCIVGVIPSFAFQRAKYCALELHRKLPTRFPSPEIVGLLELDWNEKLTEWKQTFGRDYWCLRRPVAVFFDNKFIGSDIDLIKLATLGNILFENIPRENMNFLKENFRNDYISYLKKTKRIYCYLDICVDGVYVGTLNFELFSDLVPRTCENFKSLCLGSKGPLFSYRGSRIHRIVKEGWVQGGDIQFKKGGGGYSIFCDPLEDECLGIGHNRRGVLSMANCGRNTNGSQFFITLQPSPWMDSRFVAFGQLIEGSHVLKLIENFETSYECPLKTIEIKSCGKLDLGDEESVQEAIKEEIPPRKKQKKFEKISEQILRLIMEALMSALEKKEHHIDILDDGDVPSKMNLQLYFQGFYSLPEEILIQSAQYLRNLRRHLLRLAKPSATEIVEVLTYDLLVATLTRMVNLDDIRETLGPDMYKKMISKIDMQLELCQKPYIKKFVDQVVSTAESMVDLVTKKLMHMKKKSQNINIFQEKMESWMQSFILQEVFKGDCYHISDRPSWNKHYKKERVVEKKEKELTERGGDKCCEERQKKQEKEILEKISKKFRPDEFCCLGKKIFDESSEINLYDLFSTCRYDLKKVSKNEHRMPLLDMIEFNRCKLNCMRKQENRIKSAARTCLEEKIRNWMNEVVYTPETMWIRNLVFGRDDLVYDHMEEILYGAMTVGLLEMYYFYEQYLKLCGGKKQKVITRTIYPDGEDDKNDDLRNDDDGNDGNDTSRTKRMAELDSPEEQMTEKGGQSKPACTCGHPCCVCAFDPHYGVGSEEGSAGSKGQVRRPREVGDEPEGPEGKSKIPSKKKKIKKKKKVCPPDTEMVNLNTIMAESTSLKADEIDIKSFRWLRAFILEKGCDLTSEFVTQVHNWLDGERFNYKNFISKHSLVTKASLLSLSLSLAELIMEENKMKTEIVNFIYDLWELYFNEMFKEALLQYPPEESSAIEEETKPIESNLKLGGSLRKEEIKEELEGERDVERKKEKSVEIDLEYVCKKILAEAPEFDFATYCKAYQTEVEGENDGVKKFTSQEFEPELKVPPNSEVGIEKELSASLSEEISKSSSKKTIKEEKDEENISQKDVEINDIASPKPESRPGRKTRSSVVFKEVKDTTSMDEDQEDPTKNVQEERKRSDSKDRDQRLEGAEENNDFVNIEYSSETVRRKLKKEEKKEQKEEQKEKSKDDIIQIEYSSETVTRKLKKGEKKEEQRETSRDEVIKIEYSSETITKKIKTKGRVEDYPAFDAQDSERTGKDRQIMKRRSPILIEEIVSDHSSLEESRQMPPYVLPFWVKFLTQLTKQALGNIAQVSRLPRRLYFAEDDKNNFEDKLKDWIEFNAFNPQPTKGREIIDFINLHHKSITNLEESARSYLKKKKFSLILNRCTRMRSAEAIANDIITSILEAAMTNRKESETVELYLSRIMSSAITSVQQDSEAASDKYSSKSYFETFEKESSSEMENIVEE